MADIYFADSHEYLRVEGDTATVGVSNHAQEQLGDVVYVELPQPGQQVSQGAEIGVIESVKSANEIYSPATGEVLAVNDGLPDDPAQVNTDPFGAGWLFQLKLADKSELGKLMDEDAYSSYVQGA